MDLMSRMAILNMSGTKCASASMINKVEPNDVLLGRGAPIINNEGNVRFRKVVSERKDDYNASCRHQVKQKIAREVIELIGKRKGRFLKKADDSIEREVDRGNAREGQTSWVLASDDVVLLKVKQALRDHIDSPASKIKSYCQAKSSATKARKRGRDSAIGSRVAATTKTGAQQDATVELETTLTASATAAKLHVPNIAVPPKQQDTFVSEPRFRTDQSLTQSRSFLKLATGEDREITTESNINTQSPSVWCHEGQLQPSDRLISGQGITYQEQNRMDLYHAQIPQQQQATLTKGLSDYSQKTPYQEQSLRDLYHTQISQQQQATLTKGLSDCSQKTQENNYQIGYESYASTANQSSGLLINFHHLREQDIVGNNGFNQSRPPNDPQINHLLRVGSPGVQNWYPLIPQQPTMNVYDPGQELTNTILPCFSSRFANQEPMEDGTSMLTGPNHSLLSSSQFQSLHITDPITPFSLNSEGNSILWRTMQSIRQPTGDETLLNNDLSQSNNDQFKVMIQDTLGTSDYHQNTPLYDSIQNTSHINQQMMRSLYQQQDFSVSTNPTINSFNLESSQVTPTSQHWLLLQGSQNDNMQHQSQLPITQLESSNGQPALMISSADSSIQYLSLHRTSTGYPASQLEYVTSSSFQSSMLGHHILPQPHLSTSLQEGNDIVHLLNFPTDLHPQSQL